MNFQRALQVVARQAVRKLGLEVVGRASLKGKIDLAGVYGHLADLEEASDEAIRYIDLAQGGRRAKAIDGSLGLGRSRTPLASRRTARVRPIGRAYSIATSSRAGRSAGSDAVALPGGHRRPRRTAAATCPAAAWAFLGFPCPAQQSLLHLVKGAAFGRPTAAAARRRPAAESPASGFPEWTEQRVKCYEHSCRSAIGCRFRVFT